MGGGYFSGGGGSGYKAGEDGHDGKPTEELYVPS